MVALAAILLVLAAVLAALWLGGITRLPLGVLLLVESIALLYLLLAVWPAVSTEGTVVATPTPTATSTPSTGGGAVLAPAAPAPAETAIRWYGLARRSPVTRSTGLLLVVVLAGALGAQVHAATSFSIHLGTRDFEDSWLWWYLLRPLSGAGLAVILYFVVRGGLLSTSGSGENLNEFGVAAFAGLTGLFSTPATERLHAIFDAALGSTKAPPADAAAKPVITGIAPKSLPRGTEDRTLTITGTGFQDGAKVRVGTVTREPDDPVSETTITVTLAEADVRRARTKPIVVVNPDQQASEPMTLTITAAG